MKTLSYELILVALAAISWAQTLEPVEVVTVWMNDTGLIYNHDGQSMNFTEYMSSTPQNTYPYLGDGCPASIVLWSPDTITMNFVGTSYAISYNHYEFGSTAIIYLDGVLAFTVPTNSTTADGFGCNVWRASGGEIPYGDHSLTVSMAGDGFSAGFLVDLEYTWTPPPSVPKRSHARLIGGVVGGVVGFLVLVAAVIVVFRGRRSPRAGNYPRRGFLVLEDQKQRPVVEDDKGKVVVVVMNNDGKEAAPPQYELDELSTRPPQEVAAVPGFERSTTKRPWN